MSSKLKDPIYKEAWKRTVRDTAAERDMGYGLIPDHLNGATVEFFWDYDPQMKARGLVRMQIRGRGKTTEIIVDKEKVMQFLRWV